MPEGHTLRLAARRLQPLVGHVVAASSYAPRAPARVAATIDGRRLDAVDAVGKHLLLRFEGDRTVHSHLAMTGGWHVYPAGAPWRRSRAAAWLVLRAVGLDAVEFGGPVLELLDTSALRLHPVLSRLGPDVLDADFAPRAAVARLRAAARLRPLSLADALLDQRIACGIGNIYKNDSLWACRLDPFAPVEDVDDDTLAALYLEAARQLGAAVAAGSDREHLVYGRRLCRRCGGAVSRRAQGDGARATHWCSHCQQRS